MLQNAYFLAKIGADTAENEQHVAGILPKTGNYPTGPTAALVQVMDQGFVIGSDPSRGTDSAVAMGRCRKVH